ncbi:MAG: hypothetical protein ACR65Z_06960 [Methylocystis sp.]
MNSDGRKRPGKTGQAGAKKRVVRRRLIEISIAERLQSHLLANLASRLAAEQIKSGMKKPEFAEHIGMSGSQFRYVRRHVGNPSILMLATAAARLKISLYELLEGEPLGKRKNPSGEKMVQNIGVVVEKRHRLSGMTKVDFAKMINVSVPQLYLITDGVSNPPLLTTVEIARRLDLTLWELLGVEPIRKSEDSRPAPKA